MNKGVSVAAAVLTAAIAPLAACGNQQGGQSNTSTSGTSSGSERMTTQLKGVDGNQVATATIEFTNGYATVTVEAGPNQVLSPGFHGLQIHSVGRCEPNSTSADGNSSGPFSSAGDVYQAANHSGYPASGELTALQVRSDGSAKLVTTSNLFTAADLRSSSGTALVIHETADNLTGSPSGESGKRLACGVIAAASTTTSSTTTTTTTTPSVSTVTTTVVVPPPETSTSTSTSTVTGTSTTTSIPTVTSTAPKTPTTGAGG
ncbi:superoxide dismutase family protein [Mycobacterium asiaticum]|uniref:Superoxide dismutase n=1 Tax=Mycobacterium asiaticum TaxID=1790 RepID=A0A1A3NHP8_MYCAS|nr:superoxide dismutase family protein [Mycobacterium asiaticum]OBK19917.1 superoxide dismutase [Mycobacterium asiaticum]